MDIYGVNSGQDCFRIDDLLDFSKGDELFSSSTTTDYSHDLHPPNSHQLITSFSSPNNSLLFPNNNHHSTDFTNTLCVPNDDVAELEWLSNFVDDSFSNYPTNNVTGTINFRSEASFHSRSRSKRSRAPSTNANTTWTSSTPESKSSSKIENSVKIKREAVAYSPSSSETSETATMPRRCTHCASEKTPQWRTGPMGPKTLCNACGVRYKSGRLVPEYRPAASPTFVLTQHSNSHRKVMELRRQKEMGVQQQQQEVHQLYGLHHHRNYEIC